jgi:hypothetical protein
VPISAVDCVQPAIQHTREQLFTRFRLGQWSRLALVGILAAEFRSGGCNFNPSPFLQHPRQKTGDDLLPLPGGFPGGFPHIDPAHLAQILALVGLALLAVGILLLVLLYINSVFRFILFDSVLRRECSIGEGWRRWHRAGRRFFLWQLVFQFAAMFLLLIVVGVPALLLFASGALTHPDQHVGKFIGAIVLFILVIVVVALTAGSVQVLAKDFLVPIMALENMDFADGWSRLLAFIRREPGRYIVYLLMKFVLSIAAAIVFGLLALIPVALIAVPAVLAFFAGKAAGLTWTVTTVSLAVIIGTVLFVILIYLVALVSVPATVFFPAYSIYFFASRYPNLDALLHPAPPPVPPESVVLPESPPPESPPMPPTPEPIG